MRHLPALLISLLLIVLLVPAGPSTDPASAMGYVNNQVVVHFKPGALVTCRDSALASVRGTIVDSVSVIDYYVIGLPDTAVLAAVATLDSFYCIDDVSANGLDSSNVLLTPNDYYYPDLYYLNNSGQSSGTPGADIHAEEGWNFIHGAPDVVIAIMDSGIDLVNQLDIDSLLWTNQGDPPGNGDEDNNGYIDDTHGWDFVGGDNAPQDTLEHGTLCAGYAAAKGNNAIGFAGVAWEAQLMPVQIISKFNTLAKASAWADGVIYAVNNGAKILSNSFQTSRFFAGATMVRAAYQAASNAGCVVVCAAGNSGQNNDTNLPIPTTYGFPGSIAVAGTDKNDELADECPGGSSGPFSSNVGATTVDFAAPACDLWGLFPNNGYSPHHSGTSAAAPMVAGAAALLWQQNPAWTNVQIKDRLLVTADTLESLWGKTVVPGRLNIGRALDNVPPSNVSFTVERGKHSLKLFWTDTGDDTTDGTAGKYEFRWSSTTSLSSEGTFSGGTLIPLEAPSESGTEHCMVFDGLTQNHNYYFAMKLMDKEFNWSGIGYLNTSTLASPNVEVSECPVPGRPAEGGGGEDGLVARGDLASSGSPGVVRAEWTLGNARPNPAPGHTTIQYSVKAHGPVRIALYDVAGRLVRTLVNETVDVGPHTIEWDGRSDAGDRVRGGVYYYRMIAGDWQSNRQLVMVPN